MNLARAILRVARAAVRELSSVLDDALGESQRLSGADRARRHRARRHDAAVDATLTRNETSRDERYEPLSLSSDLKSQRERVQVARAKVGDVRQLALPTAPPELDDQARAIATRSGIPPDLVGHVWAKFAEIHVPKGTASMVRWADWCRHERLPPERAPPSSGTYLVGTGETREAYIARQRQADAEYRELAAQVARPNLTKVARGAARDPPGNRTGKARSVS